MPNNQQTSSILIITKRFQELQKTIKSQWHHKPTKNSSSLILIQKYQLLRKHFHLISKIHTCIKREIQCRPKWTDGATNISKAQETFINSHNLQDPQWTTKTNAETFNLNKNNSKNYIPGLNRIQIIRVNQMCYLWTLNIININKIFL